MFRNGQKYSDETLISSLSSTGTAADDAIRMLYRNYYGLLSQYVMNHGGDSHDAEDIFQEVIIAFVNLVRAKKFRGDSGIRTFLYALNRNLWLNELRTRSRAELREEQYEKMAPKSEAVVHTAMEYRQATRNLMTVIDQLGDACKKILHMFYYENHSMKEILEVLHYENEQVVRNKKSKCLKKMEQLVQNNPSLYQQLKTLVHG